MSEADQPFGIDKPIDMSQIAMTFSLISKNLEVLKNIIDTQLDRVKEDLKR